MLKKTILTLTVLLASGLAPTSNAEAANKPNVLFIAIDDLRPELGCYGSPVAISPNLDKLADNCLLFNRAYCQEAICGPSRASLMAGARPDSIGVVENRAKLRESSPDILTLSQHFIANGYEAVQVGKIYHNLDHSDREFSWSRDPAVKRVTVGKPFHPYALPENRKIQQHNKKVLEAKYGVGIAKTGLVQGPAYEGADVEDHQYRDGYNALVAIETMKDMVEKNPEKPFFLGMGFYKPHLDLIAPKKYWDMYDPKDIPLAEQTKGPKDGAAMGLHASFEMRVRDGIPKAGDFDEELSRTLKHAYLACVSYIDAQIGLVIEGLEELGLRDNTIIIVWGDHGWHLGDMGVWCKATNYEISTRVPMMIWTPNMPAGSRGKTTDALVELVDIYPTLCELAGLELPNHLEGTSFVPLLDDPDREWEGAAFSQFPNPALREWAANPLSHGMRETFFGPLIEEVEDRIVAQQGDRWDRDLYENHLMGYTMRTDRYRLVLWKDVRNPEADPIDVELYDYKLDGEMEKVNIASKRPKLVKKLIKQFDAGWEGNQPPSS
ncbi:sulfatase [Pelagicoccus mobilis]|uniref:Sulfatase n=1 Tax=Pelagicoccus mobilis TaxID=415221 RepID=A0A934VN85_9BACT|nr:sulfatase [Pelagicoccus mobilis]MBK1879666.1 sulfatase [Pelagicoccus mobilis]